MAQIVDNSELTDKEEAIFIFKAAFAPLVIAKRYFVDKNTLGRAFELTLDRVAYARDLHERQSKKREREPAA